MLALSFSGHRGAVEFIGRDVARASYWNNSDMGLTKGEDKIVDLLVSNVWAVT